MCSYEIIPAKRTFKLYEVYYMGFHSKNPFLVRVDLENNTNVRVLKNIRLAQLYLNGASKEDLVKVLKYERLDKLERALKTTPGELRRSFTHIPAFSQPITQQ